MHGKVASWGSRCIVLCGWQQGPRGERGPQGSSGEKGDQVSGDRDLAGCSDHCEGLEGRQERGPLPGGHSYVWGWGPAVASQPPPSLSCNLSPHAQSLICRPVGAEWRTKPQDSPCHSFHLGSQAGERVAQHTAPCFLPPGIPRPARLSRPPGECRHKASSVGVLPVWQGQARRREGGPGEGREEGPGGERPGWSGLIPGTGTRRARPPGWAPAAQ